MAEYHLAQINIAQARDEMTSETMHGFASRLDEINHLAESSPGFIWRLQDDSGDATSIQAFDDPMLIINISVWSDVESLKQFVYRSVHVDLIRDRDAWFHKIPQMHQALWWVPAGHTPSVEEGKAVLERLQAEGPGPEAFTFARAYPPPE
jgi:hypothetical protein